MASQLHHSFEIASVLVRRDHVARFIVNTGHSVMRAAVEFCVLDCIADFGVPQATEWQRVANQSDAAFVFPRADFVNAFILSHDGSSNGTQRRSVCSFVKDDRNVFKVAELVMLPRAIEPRADLLSYRVNFGLAIP